jgi:hypothetical protein
MNLRLAFAWILLNICATTAGQPLSRNPDLIARLNPGPGGPYQAHYEIQSARATSVVKISGEWWGVAGFELCRYSYMYPTKGSAPRGDGNEPYITEWYSRGKEWLVHWPNVANGRVQGTFDVTNSPSIPRTIGPDAASRINGYGLATFLNRSIWKIIDIKSSSLGPIIHITGAGSEGNFIMDIAIAKGYTATYYRFQPKISPKVNFEQRVNNLELIGKDWLPTDVTWTYGGKNPLYQRFHARYKLMASPNGIAIPSIPEGSILVNKKTGEAFRKNPSGLLPVNEGPERRRLFTVGWLVVTGIGFSLFCLSCYVRRRLS